MNATAEPRKLSTAQNAMLNTVGTVAYFVCQWLITLAVVRLSTEENIGLLQLSMTISNLFLSIANYNMRVFQVSDIRGEYEAGHYTASRLLTCGAALLLCAGYAVLWGYSASTVLCVCLYMVYRLNESLADVLHGVDQLHDRMDHVAVSMSLRGVLMLLFFCLVIRLTGRLSLAAAAIAAVTYAVIALYDLPAASRYARVAPVWDRRKVSALLRACLPNMAATVAFISIVTLSRQFLADLEGEVSLGYYATVATPVVFVQVIMNSLMNPTVGEISAACLQRDRKRFFRLHARLFLLVLGVGGLTLAGLALLGRPVMALLYGEKILPHVYLMNSVLGTTVLYALCCVLQNTLVIFRKMGAYMAISLASLALTAFAGRPLIAALGPAGVNAVICLSYLFFFVCALAVCLVQVRAWGRKEGKA